MVDINYTPGFLRGHGGGKSGGSASGPQEAKNTLKSRATARILELLSEGEIVGLFNGTQSIFLEDTPLEAIDGSHNFEGFAYDLRYGLPDQTYMSGFSQVETENEVGVEVTYDTPITRTINDPLVDAVRVTIRLPVLTHTNDDGDLNGTFVVLAIQYRSFGGPWVSPNIGTYMESFSPPISPESTFFRITVRAPKASLPTDPDTLNTAFIVGLKYRIAGSGSAYTELPGKTYNQVKGGNIGSIIGSITGGSPHAGASQNPQNFIEDVSTTYEITLANDSYEFVPMYYSQIAAAQCRKTTPAMTIVGKTTSPYERSYRFNLPEGGAPWDIRVSRLQPDPEEAKHQNRFYFSRYTEIIDEKFIYPNSALIGVAIDAEQFEGKIPSRSYLIKGIKISIPSNYDPITRTYDGIWDGLFVTDWSNNPVWVLYDLITNRRYGIGRFLNVTEIDKWSFYDAAKYCDEDVPNLYGGVEPRFTFNAWIADRTSALEALQSVASSFRGMIYWSAGAIFLSIDRPKSPTKIFTASNVIDGDFVYQGTSLKDRHTLVRVTWNDPDDFYRPAIEVVEDPDGMVRYGLRDTDLRLLGCSSQGQAYRHGRWTLDTEKSEREMVTFSISWRDADILPGEIFSVQDPFWSGAKFGGRLKSVAASKANLDRSVTLEDGQDYTLWAVMPNGVLQTSPVVNDPGSWDVLNLANPFNFDGNYIPNPDLAGIVEGDVSSTGSLPTGWGWQGISGSTLEILDHGILDGVPFINFRFTWTSAPTATAFITMAPLGVIGAAPGDVWNFAMRFAPLSAWDTDIVSFGHKIDWRDSGSTLNTDTYNYPNPDLQTFDKAQLLVADAPVGTLTARPAARIQVGVGTSGVIEFRLGGWFISSDDEQPMANAVWALVATNIEPRPFRCLMIRETDTHLFEVTGLFYDVTKFARVEEDITIVNPRYYHAPTGPLLPPTNLSFQEYLYKIGNTVRSGVTVSWTAPNDGRIIFYEFQLRDPITDAYTTISTVTTTSTDVREILYGIYGARVRSIDGTGTKKSPWLTVDPVQFSGLLGPPGDVQNFRANIIGDTIFLLWDRVTDLDLDHYRLKFSPEVVGASWTSSTDLFPIIPREATNVSAPFLNGTYLIKAVDFQGVESSVEAIVINLKTGGLNQNTVLIIQEDPTFAGTKDDVYYSVTLGGIRLIPESYDFFTLTDVFDLSDFFFGEGVVAEGYYYFDNDVDLGEVFTSRLVPAISVTGANVLNDFFGPEDMYSVADMFGSLGGGYDAILEVRYTQDDPSGSPTWTPWYQFLTGDYTARAFQFRLHLLTTNPSITPVVTKAAVTVDMPDRVDGMDDVSGTAGGIRITFDPAFRAKPSIVITGQSMDTGDYFELSNQDETGFDVIFYNASAVSVTRVFDWHARGYGYRIV